MVCARMYLKRGDPARIGISCDGLCVTELPEKNVKRGDPG
jgi:hypothetical protein